MSIPWGDFGLCPECVSPEGHHQEYCSLYKPDYETDNLYRLTKACPICSPANPPCVCHHPARSHNFDDGICDLYLSCECEQYRPMDCTFSCQNGRYVPEAIKRAVRWWMTVARGDFAHLIHALEAEAMKGYPSFSPDPSAHYNHIHIDMRSLNEPKT